MNSFRKVFYTRNVRNRFPKLIKKRQSMQLHCKYFFEIEVYTKVKHIQETDTVE